MRSTAMLPLLAACALAGWLLAGTSARAEVSEIKIAHESGLAHFGMMVVEHEKLIEKYAKQDGLGEVSVQWVTMPSATAMIDGLLSGAVDMMQSGAPSLITLWSKTAAAPQLAVKGVSPIDRIVFRLNTRNPAVRTVADFTEKDKIALPGVKVSLQAILLQMAAEKAFGPGNFAKLDPLTVTMAHSQAAVQLISGTGEVNSHFAGPPYDSEELKNPQIHTVLTSVEATEGGLTSGVLMASARFYGSNPRLIAATRAALDEAITIIGRDPTESAKLYLAISKEKGKVEEIAAIISKIEYDRVPRGVMKFADFMQRVGDVPTKPATIEDLFVPGAKLSGAN